MLNLAFPALEWAELLTPESPEAADIHDTYARKRAAQDAQARSRTLSDLVRTEVIPRLRLLHPAAPPATPKIDADQIAQFTTTSVLCRDSAPAVRTFSDLLAKGYSADSLFLDLLAPSAALLGRLWDEDLCDFIEVTAGLARLQLLLATFRVEGSPVSIDNERCILLMGAPDEQHSFGLGHVGQFLCKAGWQVRNALQETPHQITEVVGAQWFGVVGLTLSCETHVDRLTLAIREVRRASRNPSVGIMVGGPVFLQKPELVAIVGADASAVDAPTAVLLAQNLLDLGRLASRCGNTVEA